MKKYFVVYQFANTDTIAKGMMSGKMVTGSNASMIVELNGDTVTMEDITDACRKHLEAAINEGMRLLKEDMPAFVKTLLKDHLQETPTNSVTAVISVTPL